MRKHRRLGPAIIGVVLAGVILGVWLALRPAGFEHPKVTDVLGVQAVLAHGSLQEDPTSGCAACHLDPIDMACTDCHATPPTIIKGNKNFPHHDINPGGPPDNCQSGNCHQGTRGDARYVVSPVANHPYCEGCHQLEHSSP